MEMLKTVNWIGIFYALGIFILGYFLSRTVSRLVSQSASKHFSKHQVMLIRRLVFYGLFLIFLATSLQQLGFKLTVLLGAAGVFTVALGFASQTAASNLISGIFLLFDKPFQVGDIVQLRDLMGTVETIDLLSTKIRTFDNICVRVPNETLIKSEISNLSFYSTRRADVLIGVAYDCNIEQVKTLLLEHAKKADDVLKDPEPRIIINNFGDSAIELKLMLWTKTDDVFLVRNRFREEIKALFDKEGIEIPFPQVTIHKAEVP